MRITLDIKIRRKEEIQSKTMQGVYTKKTFHSIDTIRLQKICMKMDYVMAL